MRVREVMDSQSAQDQSLLGRVFDAYQNLMQIARCVREAARQTETANPRILELSRRHTTLSDYLPEARMERYATHDGERPVLTMPLRLPFPDKSFDVCIVSDMYEHIPNSQRHSLIGEMMRVSDGLVLLGCPMRDELVTRFDRIAFDFIWGKYGDRYPPLRQHVEFGLDPLEKVLDSFTTQGAKGAVALPSNYVYRWVHQILIYFDLQYAHPDVSMFEAINRAYNEKIAQYDYREPAYHYLIVVGTTPRINLEVLAEKLQGPCEVPESVAEAEGALIEAFRSVDSRASDQLGKSMRRIEQLTLEIERLNRLLTPGERWRGRIVRKLKWLVVQVTRGGRF